MGLLDDAIREHLELKRRRGADPGEVAREQREALDVSYETQPADEHGDGPDAAGSEHAGGDAIPGLHGAVEGETAELDMEAVLAEDSPPAQTALEEDSLEWEMPHQSGTSHLGEASLGADEAPSSAVPE